MLFLEEEDECPRDLEWSRFVLQAPFHGALAGEAPVPKNGLVPLAEAEGALRP